MPVSKELGQRNRFEFAAPIQTECPICEGKHLIEVVPMQRALTFRDRYFMCGNCGYATKFERILIEEIPNGNSNNQY